MVTTRGMLKKPALNNGGSEGQREVVPTVNEDVARETSKANNIIESEINRALPPARSHAATRPPRKGANRKTEPCGVAQTTSKHGGSNCEKSRAMSSNDDMPNAPVPKGVRCSGHRKSRSVEKGKKRGRAETNDAGVDVVRNAGVTEGNDRRIRRKVANDICTPACNLPASSILTPQKLRDEANGHDAPNESSSIGPTGCSLGNFPQAEIHTAGIITELPTTRVFTVAQNNASRPLKQLNFADLAYLSRRVIVSLSDVIRTPGGPPVRVQSRL